MEAMLEVEMDDEAERDTKSGDRAMAEPDRATAAFARPQGEKALMRRAVEHLLSAFRPTSRQWARNNGMPLSSIMVRVTPPNASSRSFEWP